jgi:NADH:ubiquinone reductase (H+-translocating)
VRRPSCNPARLGNNEGRMADRSPHIVVLGAGFAGLTFCREFREPDVRITLVDQHNHHLFQPLLYQVATAGLAAPDIAEPIRSILRGHPNVTVRLDTVTDIRLATREVVLEHTRLGYDYLVLALGGVTSYFGHPEWEKFAPGLKSLGDALRIRQSVLCAYEQAEIEPDRTAHDRLMTVVVVGGGATGVEMAGAFAELARHVLRKDFRHIDPSQARVILLEGGPRILAHLPEELSASAQRQLERLHVEVRTGAMVKNITPNRVELADESCIEAENIIWTAGIAAHPITRQLGVEVDRAGRIKIKPDLSIPGHPEAFALGDIAVIRGANGQPVPWVSPAAMQMARHVARLLREELRNRGDAGGSGDAQAQRPAFRYSDKGTMATIGRSAAVAHVGRLQFSGWPAWIAWLLVHLVFLVGFGNKLAVLTKWTYSYFTYKRGARLIINGARRPPLG